MGRHGKNLNDGQEAIDILYYYYRGNQIIAIDDAVTYNNLIDFYDNGHYYNMGSDTQEYYYDANGNLKKDVNKGILNITYNDLNLPTVIDKTGNYRIEYEYDALGIKHRQTVIHGGKVAKVTDFVGNFVYERNQLAWQSFDEGRVVYKNDSTCFAETYIKDHLGNVRVAFGNDGSGFGVRQVNAYYPFGMSIRTLSSNSANTTHRNEYGYNGKMYQDELGLNWYDYGARFYDPVVGRWWSVDPLAEQYRRWTPYNYCIDNPMRFVDPDGMRIDKYYGSDGSLLHDTKVGNREFIIKTTTTKEKLLETSKVNPDLIADVNGISPEAAAIATNEVSSGNVEGAHMSSFIELDSKSTRTAMAVTVKAGKDDGSGGSKPSNNREVGSTISPTGGVGQPIYGKVGDLSTTDTRAEIEFSNLLPGTRTFHGHPSGSSESKSWSQFPSKQDQNTASSGNHYVFPMQQGQSNVYLYNNKGIQALVPYKLFEK